MMIFRLLEFVVVKLLSLIQLLLFLTAKMAGIFNKRIYEFTAHRFDCFKLINDLSKDHAKTVLFFCSSAGEWEQSLPIAQRLQEKGFMIFFLFFSPSGLKYAQARQSQYPISLAPIDIDLLWQYLFKRLRPTVTIVVRHELWPAFLYVGHKYSRLILVNFSTPTNQKIGVIKAWLLKFFNHIFVVDESAFNALHNKYPPKSITLSGDTKYDRVLERVKENSETVHQLKKWLTNQWGTAKYFIAGSAWHADIETILGSYQRIKDKLQDRWIIIIAPHDVSPSMVNWIESLAKEHHLHPVRWSVVSQKPQHKLNENVDLLIIDQIGYLAEFYAVATLGLVGGAFHHKIHNVLEPAAYGLPICFGPRYQNQQEAKVLVKHHLATVLYDKLELDQWWLNHQQVPEALNTSIVSKIREMSGATEIIINKIGIPT